MKNCFVIILIVFLGLFLSCEKEKAVFSPPELGDLKITYLTDSSVNVECSILETGGLDVIERGFCWFPKNDSSQICYKKLTSHDSFFAKISGLDNTSYYICGFAKNVSGTTYCRALVINGHKCVDLGLPSGTLWAASNIGANASEDFGNFYAWGETTTKENYNWESYIYAEGTTNDYPGLIKYCNSYTYSNHYTDDLIVLETSDDVAIATWGASWRMPTYTEFVELKNNCTATWVTQNGVNGQLFTGTNGNTIFFPAAGYRKDNELISGQGRYWSSSLYTERSRSAEYMYFDSNSCDIKGYYRCQGYSVRAVVR